MVGNTSALFLWPVLFYLRALVQVALASPFNHMSMAESKRSDTVVICWSLKYSIPSCTAMDLTSLQERLFRAKASYFS